MELQRDYSVEDVFNFLEIIDMENSIQEARHLDEEKQRKLEEANQKRGKK